MPSNQVVEDEVSLIASHLPMAELMNGGLIRLPGIGGYSNPDSLLEPSCLKGKLTIDEYRSAITYINSCVSNSQMEANDLIWPEIFHVREMAKARAGKAAVEKLNQQYHSVRFTYLYSVEKVEYVPIYDPRLRSGLSGMAERYRYKTVRSYIYINVN